MAGQAPSFGGDRAIDINTVHQLAERLIFDGFADNEADARLLAVQIIVAAESRSRRADRTTNVE